MADFRVRTPAIDPQAFANVLQRKRQMEEEQNRYEQERKDNRLKRITDAVIAGQNIASNMLSIADKRQEVKRNKLKTEGQQELIKLFQEPSTLPDSDPLKAQLEPAFQDDRKKRFLEAVTKADLDGTTKALLEQNLPKPNPKGTPPRSIEGLLVSQFNNGEITEEQLKEKMQEFKPATSIITDNEGNKFLYDERNRSLTALTGPSKPGDAGKDKRVQFTPEEQKVVLDSRKAFAEDDYVKKSLPLLKTLEKTRQLVEENPQGNIGPIQTDAARLIAGEVARLTDDDIGRNIPTQDWDEQFKQWVQKRTNSNLSKISKERYLQLLDIVQKKYADSLNTTLDDIVNDTAQFGTLNANKEALRQTIGRGAIPFIDKYKSKESFASPDDIKKASTADLQKRLEKLKAGTN